MIKINLHKLFGLNKKINYRDREIKATYFKLFNTNDFFSLLYKKFKILFE